MRRLVTVAGVATLATLGRDGRPHLVPITFAFEDETLYTAVDSKPKRTRALVRLDNIERDPRVGVLVQHYDEDWTRLWWVRIDGTARIVGDGEEFEKGRDSLARKYRHYRTDPPAGPVIVVEVDGFTGWAATGKGS